MILIAASERIHREVALLVAFFEQGLSCFHLRKETSAFCVDFLERLPLQYHHKVVLHEHLDLLPHFQQLRGFHLRACQRTHLSDDLRLKLGAYQERGHTISTGFHALNELNKPSSMAYDYAFLSPVFDSISKRNYKGRGFDLNHVKKPFPIVALGGVTPKNKQVAFDLGFDEIAVLGGIWSASRPLKAFQQFNA